MNKNRLVRLNNHHGYVTSRDYETLYCLLRKTSVICIVNYSVCRDIASTAYRSGVSEITSRGICYIGAETLADFVEQCIEGDVEFIVPFTNHL